MRNRTFYGKLDRCNGGRDYLSFSSVSINGINTQSKPVDTFEASNQKVSFYEFLARKGKVTREEYEEIKSKNPKIFGKAKRFLGLFPIFVFGPKEMAKVVLGTDKYFKENFENYRIISIGTSPSPITEQLANLGHDIVFLPASGMMAEKEYDIKKGNYTKQLDALLDYLSTKNINDGKLNLVLDYTLTGKSLKYLSEVIQKRFGLEDDKIRPIALNDVLKHNSDDSSKKLLKTLECSIAIESVSNVPHYAVNDVMEKYMNAHPNYFLPTSVFYKEGVDLGKKFEEYSSELARAFSLCTMREIEEIKAKESR